MRRGSTLLIGVVCLASFARCGDVSLSDKLKDKDKQDQKTHSDSANKNKPGATDLSGTPGNFNGKWSGSCSYMDGGSTASECKVDLTIQQTTQWISGSLKYSASSKPIMFHPYYFVTPGSNKLRDQQGNEGAIGTLALGFRDMDMVEFTAKIFPNGELGVNVARLPDRGGVCSSEYCFTGKLKRSRD